MGKVKTLKEEVYRKIAAGEVVERPLSVVKELVENSLDAGAERVKVELEHGGKTMVRVTDDGSGFEADDVEAAFQRHSTSKFRDFSDFDSLYTLGFRGEALPSILEVSDILVETSADSDGEGQRFRFTGSQLQERKSIACPRGSSITVRNLFSNFPVRRKFLKSDRSEMNQITAFLEQAVLVNHTVTFEMIHNGRTVFSYNGVPALRERSYQMFGKGFTDDLADVDFEFDGYRMKGMVSKLNTGVAGKKRQYFFVNGRNVREKTLYAALNNTFQRYLEKSRSPVGIILLDIPPGDVDVNIHPMKLEIKFEDSSRVFRLIRRGIESTMIPAGGNEPESDFPRIQVFPRGAETEKESGDEAGVLNQGDLFSGSISMPEDEFSLIGQYRDSYIIIEKEGDLLVVDQHNADERAKFDKLKTDYNAMEAPSVSPLFPLLVELSPGEAERLDGEKLAALSQAGFEIVHMGGSSFDIKRYPEILSEKQVEETFRQILSIEAGELDFEDRTLAEIACKSAIKVNHKLHHDQMRKIVRKLFKSSNPWFCPHKRPIIVNFSQGSIEKSLKRR